MTVIISPQTLTKPVRKTVYIRDVREHRKLEMNRKLDEWDLSNVYNCDNAKDMVNRLKSPLSMLFDGCFPKMKVKSSSRESKNIRYRGVI